MVALEVNKEMRDLVKGLDRGVERRIDDWEVARALEKHKYALCSDSGESGYGLRVTESRVVLSGDLLKRNKKEADKKTAISRKAPVTPFYSLTVQGRIVLLLFFSAVLVLLLYYESGRGDTGFERFMNSQRFGVRFFFTALGVALGSAMDNFFRCRSPRLKLLSVRSVLIPPYSRRDFVAISADVAQGASSTAIDPHLATYQPFLRALFCTPAETPVPGCLGRCQFDRRLFTSHPLACPLQCPRDIQNTAHVRISEYRDACHYATSCRWFLRCPLAPYADRPADHRGRRVLSLRFGHPRAVRRPGGSGDAGSGLDGQVDVRPVQVWHHHGS